MVERSAVAVDPRTERLEVLGTGVIGDIPQRPDLHRLVDRHHNGPCLGFGMVGRRQESTEILTMDSQTAEALLEKRYLGLDLLDGDAAATGGVTPVVTAADGCTV